MKSRGLSLVEAIVGLAVAIVAGGLLVTIIINTGNLFYKQSSKLQEGLNINDALYEVRQSIRLSSAVALSYSSSGTTYTSSPEQLVLKLSSIDSSGNIILNTFDYFVFFKDQNIMRFKTFPDTLSARKMQDQVFSTSLDSLTFNFLDLSNPPNEVAPNLAKKVRISLTLKQKVGLGYETKSAVTEANLRND